MYPRSEPGIYICADCGLENKLKPGDVMRCRGCGYPVLFKKTVEER